MHSGMKHDALRRNELRELQIEKNGTNYQITQNL